MTIDAHQQVFGSGAPFETGREAVLGEELEVYKQRHRSLVAMLESSQRHGEAEFIVDGEVRLTYVQHLTAVRAAALVLRESYDIQPGDRVAILAENRATWIIAFWATIWCGGIVTALNGWWTEDEIRYGLALTDPKLLIADAKRLARLADTPAMPVLNLDTEADLLLAGEGSLPPAEVREDDPVLILFTSGTTGRPKGATVSHRGLIGFVQNTFANAMLRSKLAGAPPAAQPRPQTITLATAPLFHISGLQGAMLLGVSAGGKIVLRQGRFDPAHALQLMQDERVTSWGPLGDMAPRVLEHPNFDSYDLSSVQSVSFGGAPVRPDLTRRMRKAFPNARSTVSSGYGSSESVGTLYSIGGAEFAANPTSAGRLMPCVDAEIRREDGSICDVGEYGEIHARSPFVFLGYWNNPEATASALKPGRWLAMGDIGMIDEAGLLFINSRARDLILRGAENIYPVEIEQRLEAHLDVKEAAVVGVEHETLGQEVKAVVVSDAALDADGLAAFVGEMLAPFKVPAHWDFRTAALPRNAAGKVLKDDL